MPKRIVIIQGHPDSEGAHFCHALADAYGEAALAAGHFARAHRKLARDRGVESP